MNPDPNSQQPSEEAPATLMVVDDHDILRERLVNAFKDRGYNALGASNYDEALHTASCYAPTMAVLDLKMPGASGLNVLEALLAEHPEMRIVMLTGYGSIATAVEAMRLGAVHFIAKPADADDILAAFEGPSADEATADTPTLARAEWEHIQRVLGDCDGNISEAARRLGLHRRSLQRKLQKYPPQR